MKHIILCAVFLLVTSLQARGDTPPSVGINGGGCEYYGIQNAINAASSEDTIQVAAGTYNENLDIGSKNLTISGDYTSDCTDTGGGTTTVNGSSGSDSVFDISDSTVTLEDLQITEGSATYGGGLNITSGSQVTLDNTIVTLNTATNGGGVYIDIDSHLIMNLSEIYNNTATSMGGGAYVMGTLTANDNDSDIYSNSAPHGGGLAVPGGTVNLIDADMYQNSATADTGMGGAILVYDEGEIILSNSTYIYYGNQAYDGAGIYADNSTVTSQGYRATFRQNTASHDGGAIYLTNSSELNLIHADVGVTSEGLENKANRGAGIYVDNSTVNLTDTKIINNIATTYGGAVFVNSGDINFINTITIMNNSANYGGAVYQLGGTIDFMGSWTIEDNSATTSGGALCIAGSGVTSFYAEGESSLSSNQADSDGGAVYLHNNSTVKLHASYGYNLNILNNDAGGNGGAFLADSGGFFDGYGQLVIDGNTASGNGGAYYISNSSKVWLDDSGSASPKIQSNRALNGGAVYAGVNSIVDCDGAEFGKSVTGNYASNGSGGAIYLINSTLMADNCKFYNNQVTEKGGAIYGNNSSLDIKQTNLNHNSAADGGAIFQTGASASAEVANCLIHHNAVSTCCGAGIRAESGTLDLIHTTITDNTGGAGVSADSSAATSTYNSILWENSISGFAGTTGFYGCNIDGSGNIGTNIDPLFVSPGSGEDYLLQESSPGRNACVDAGYDIDIEGQSRPNETGYDMGAYEYYLPEYNVAALPDPMEGGSISGSGEYVKYSTATLNAEADSGYIFNHWYLSGTVLSTGNPYSFTVKEGVILIASFSAEQSEYLISSVSEDHGTISGDGTYSHGSEVTITAHPDSGYKFSHWVETWDGLDGSITVSTDEEYTFTADRDRNLTAVFKSTFNPGVLMLLLDEE